MLRLRYFLSAMVFLFCSANVIAQTCTGLGQNPGTAFPVCGTADFTQTTVASCGGTQVPGPCNNVPLTDINPYWYQFTCFAPGTLSFSIKPNTPSDDYDWQLFDITNRNPSDIYSDASLFVSCNWSGEGGETGANASGTRLAECDGLGVPLFSRMPNLILGHTYLLLVSHFTANSQSGYSLSFSGPGTASITDPVEPHLASVKAPCDGTKIYVKLNKKMKCSSIKADGSDFQLIPNIAPIISTVGVGCNSGFDTDSLILTAGAPLTPGNYKLTIKSTANIVDNCDRPIPFLDTLNITIYPLVPTPMDSIGKVGCSPNEVVLYFRTPIRCNTIAPDGSDFTVSGTSPITISGAAGNCNTDGLTDILRVTFSGPIQTAGNYQIQLKTGSDGNTILNECGQFTPPGARLNFSTKDTVNAAFSNILKYGCTADTVQYVHNGLNGVDQWNWSFPGNIRSSARDTSIVHRDYGIKTTTLIVSNGVCKDTATQSVNLDNEIKVNFRATRFVCPNEEASFTDLSSGSLNNQWLWEFGNGLTSTQQNPPNQVYPPSSVTKDITIKLTVTNRIGCSAMATQKITVPNNCYITVPSAFTPNGDGLNDLLYPTNAYKATNLLFRVYNRNGQLLFETRNWLQRWDGYYGGNPQDPGTYVWILSYTTLDTGVFIQQKGTTVLIR